MDVQLSQFLPLLQAISDIRRSQENPRMVSNQVSVAVGLAMIVAGIGLWGVSAYAQLQRVYAAAPPLAAPCSACPELPPAPACPPGLATSSTTASATVAPSTSAVSVASASASTAVATENPAAGGLFRFELGKAVFKKDEIGRLLTFGREQLKTPRVRLLIEGMGDEEGPKGIALGRSRGVVARQLLSDAGFDSERLVLAPPRAFTSPEEAGVWLRPMEATSP
jgi:hypothetical protein